MRFGVLGPLAVWTADGNELPVPEAKVRALLADLLLHEGRPVPVERLLADLWGADLPGNPANTLQTKVSHLRKVLDAAEPGTRRMVIRRPPGYALATDAGSVDLQRFRALTAQARATPAPRERAALLGEALALWRGPALADVAGEPFAAGPAQRLEEERLAAVEEHLEARLALGEHGALVGELADLVAQHPLRERLRGLQMRALYRAGRQSAALDSFAQLRAALVDELGLEPGPELTELQRAILARDPSIAGPPTTGRTNIAPPLTELVGRACAVQQVRARIAEARLVTLTGPGGVGKTRLAIETARRLADADGPAGGVWLVELAGVEPASVSIAEAVAATFGVCDAVQDPEQLVEHVGEALRTEDVLLVLDNCEHVAGPVADLVRQLLEAAPRLRLLATSREPLGVPGEVLWNVPPLALPAPTDELAAVREASAVRLFVARAAAAAPGFVLDAETAPAVAAICRRLDGIPLALELAAGRVRALGVHELLARLDDRFRLLTGGTRDAPARQRTLRAVIDWSWETLSPPERAVLRRLAVHVDGCALDAAESVCAGDGVPPEDVLDLVARLVDRSLVVSQAPTSVEPRFRLLETVAAYCLERLDEAGEAEHVRQQHINHYLALAERADPELRGPRQRQWLERLDVESANLRAAFEHATAGGAAPALRLAKALTWYWFLRGRFGEAARSLRRALAAPGAAPPVARAHAEAWLTGLRVLDGERPDRALFDPTPVADAATAHMRWFVGYALTTIGDMPAAQRLTTAALAAFEATGDRWGTAAALADRAHQLMNSTRLDDAGRLAARSAELFAEVGDRWGPTQSTFVLGALAEVAGDYESAERHHRHGLRMAEELGLWGEVSYQLSWLGRVALLTGRLAEADELHGRAARIATEHGFAPGRIYAITGLALGARRAGRLDEAEAHLQVALEWHRGTDLEPANSLILAELGFVAELRGDAALATRLHADGHAIACRFGDPRAIALALEGLAGAAALGYGPERAARLLGAAAALREGVGRPLPAAERVDVDRATEKARRALGEATFEAEFTRGAHSQPPTISTSVG